MAYAAAVNEEIKRPDARPAPTSSSSTSPGCRRAPSRRARYGVKAINRALEGITGTTAVHLCFGYAARRDRTSRAGYSFLPQLADTRRRADLDRGRAAASSISAC